MKRKNDFAAKLLAVCLALVLAAGMLAVPAMATGTATPSPANSTAPGGEGGDDTGNGGSNGITGGMPYITGYTVAPQLGVSGELQRIQPGQKCCIIVSICDPRFTKMYEEKSNTAAADTEATAHNKALESLMANAFPNIKITSTYNFASPSLGAVSYTHLDVYKRQGQQWPRGC